ncbi:hypothetical protein E2C01_013186 [Portunus trituberculatus]|uniref:Uncharacterized protein n=1 Tax=Portunus trituberculatus TaxID=210409 RepID=A0A5B7DFL2_PORTR|nr:hypothetical protein [Portunus trituberculatus]
MEQSPTRRPLTTLPLTTPVKWSTREPAPVFKRHYLKEMKHAHASKGYSRPPASKQDGITARIRHEGVKRIKTEPEVFSTGVLTQN